MRTLKHRRQAQQSIQIHTVTDLCLCHSLVCLHFLHLDPTHHQGAIKGAIKGAIDGRARRASLGLPRRWIRLRA